ncbi:MAG: rhomboid family intramembrane serine protease [Phycisphaerae bacterium]|nr:rhomboid family intramembrane serine protease [Phycisphaerae bacterium]
MNCPVCGSKMTKARIGDIAVETCPSCDGIWFEPGAFLPVAQALADKTNSTADLTFLFKPRQVQEAISDTRRLCPRCTVSLRNFNYGYDSNILLDKCPQCGGVWTDRGEIRQVAAHLKGDPRVEEIGRDLMKRQVYLDKIAEKPQPLSPLMFYLPHFLPIGDDLRRQRFPVLTLGVIVLCGLVFGLTTHDFSSSRMAFRTWGHTPAECFSATLFTSMFLHANIIHLLGNMYFLWLFGNRIEDRLGRVWFVPFYIAAGLAGSFAHAVMNFSSTAPSIGASGAVSGLMGAYMVFYPRANVKLFVWGNITEVTAVFYLGIWFTLQVANGLLYGTGEISSVAWFAHIGGFSFGAAAAYFVQTRRHESDI